MWIRVIPFSSIYLVSRERVQQCKISCATCRVLVRRSQDVCVKLLEDLVKHMLDVVGSFGALLGNETKRQELFFKAHRGCQALKTRLLGRVKWGLRPHHLRRALQSVKCKSEFQISTSSHMPNVESTAKSKCSQAVHPERCNQYSGSSTTVPILRP